MCGLTRRLSAQITHRRQRVLRVPVFPELKRKGNPPADDEQFRE
jgi:hypothetical protein